MNNKLVSELIEIDSRLEEIIEQIGGDVYNTELFDSWNFLHSYLLTIEAIGI